MAKEPESTVPKLEELLRRYPGKIRVIRRLAEMSVVQRNYVAGVKYYKTLHELDPENKKVTAKLAETLLLLAREKFAAKEYDDAFELFDESFRIQFPDAKLKQEFVGLLVSRGRYAEAVSILEPLRDADSQLQLATILEMNGDVDRALKILLDLEQNASLGRQGEQRIARLLMAKKDYDAAAERLTELTAKSPDDLELQRAFIDAVAGSKLWNDATRRVLLDVYRRQQKTEFQTMDEEGFERLGNALKRLELFEEAIVALNQALVRYPHNKPLRLLLAETLGNLGRDSDAEKHYKALLENNR
jgi:tetratricopeptide (TPR) repeat protein